MRLRTPIAALSAALIGLALLAPAPAVADPLGDAAAAMAREHLDAWDMAGAEKAVAKLTERYPDQASTLLMQGRLHLLEGRYEEAVAPLQQAVSLGGGAMALHYLQLAENTHDETKNYVHHTTRAGNFRISHKPGIDAVLVPYAEEALESAFEELTQLFGYTPPTPIRVELYPRVETLGKVSSLTVKAIKTSGTIALCKYNRLMVVSPRDLVYGYDWTDTLAHELIHLLITQKSRNKVPIWLHEGLAKHYEGLWRKGHKPALTRSSEDLLARALEKDALISFEDMSPSMALLPSQEATATAFAEVFTVIEFLEQRRGRGVAEQLVALMGQGKSDKEAVAAVAGVPWRRFQPTWEQFLKTKGLRKLDDAFDQRLLFRGTNTEAEELEALKGEEARRFTWLGDQLRLRERFRAAAKEYHKAIKIVGDKTPLIQSKLGYALLKLGLTDQAIDALESPLSHYPNYVLLHLYLGEAYLLRGEWETARKHLEEAVRLNPFDPDLHGHLAKVYEQLGEPELAERERKAHRLINKR